MKELTLGVLLCDHVARDLLPVAGDYPDMFSRLFADYTPEGANVERDGDVVAMRQRRIGVSPVFHGRDARATCLFPQHLTRVRLRFYDITVDEYPERLDDCDGYLTTGSATSVNDDEPWVAALEEFIRRLHDEQVKLFAICFGHQMVAKSLGGSVDVSERGWGVGVHEVVVARQEPWMIPEADSYNIIGSHSEQITKLPAGSVLLASTPHCPVAMFRCGSLVGIQGHPEFRGAYARALMNSRSDIIPATTRATAEESFTIRADYTLLVSWILRYVEKELVAQSSS